MAQLKTMLIAVLFFGLAGVGFADEPALSEKARKFAQACADAGKKAIANEETTIARLRKSLADTIRKRYVNSADKQRDTRQIAAAIKASEAKLAELKKTPIVIPAINLDSMKVGDIGRMSWYRDQPGTCKVRQVIDEGNMICDLAEFVIWVSAPTKGIADGATYVFSPLVEITGTKTYATAIGTSRTVLVFTPVDFDSLIPPK